MYSPKKQKEIIEGGDSIVCESSPSENGEGHAGRILKKCEDGTKTLLGTTDPIFKTADEAKTAAEEAVKSVRMPGAKPPCQCGEPQVSEKVSSKKKKRKEKEYHGE